MTPPGLLVGTWPPRRCGIAAYNEQMRAAEGWVPFDASPEHPLSFRPGAFLRALRGHETMRISFDPYALACGSLQALWTYPLLMALQCRHRIEIVVHEPWKARSYASGAANSLYRSFCRRVRWLVHVPSQSDALRDAFGDGLDIATLPHGGHFRKAYAGTREQARGELGLDASETWLCIGFVTAAKGFSRFVRAFGTVAGDAARVHVVGSVRTDEAADREEARELHAACADSSSRALFHEEFVDDVAFDRWIAASDVVVLPYRETSTSGVVERARLFGKVVLARDLAGLREAVAGDPRAILYRDESLPEAVAAVRVLLRGGAG